MKAWRSGQRLIGVPSGTTSSFIADAVIKDDLRAACRANMTFEAYWLTVRDWSHERRYPGDANPVTRKDGLDLLLAVINPNNGVMKWLQELYRSI